jgi:hypothetical protein
MRSIIAALTFLLAPVLAYAAPVTWTLNDVSFETLPDAYEADTGMARGSFDFDADTGIFSNISISMDPYLYDSPDSSWLYGFTRSYGSSGYDGLYFNHIHPNAGGDSNRVGLGDTHYYDGDNNYLLVLRFAEELTNAGGVIGFDSGSGIVFGGPGRMIASGTVSAAGVVPIPAAVWLFGSALAGLGWFRRRTQS